MKTTTIYIALLSLVFGAIICSCKKKTSEVPAPAPSKTAMLTAKSWKVTSTLRATGKSPNEKFPNPECFNDNYYQFYATSPSDLTGPAIYNKGVDKCESPDDNSNGTWTLNSNQTQLQIILVPALYSFTVDSLTITPSKMTGQSNSLFGLLDMTFTPN